MVMQINQQTPAIENSDSAGRLTVLIVDDSKVIRLALSKILREEFEVLQAADGELAWSILSENRNISAVFSDLSMPNLDGYGLLDRIRNSGDTYLTDLPFIVITGNDETAELLNKVRTKGGNDLITKPFKTDEIRACVTRYLTDHSDDVQDDIPNIHDVAEETQNEIVNDLHAEKILGLDDHVSNVASPDNEVQAPASEQIEETSAAKSSSGTESFLDFTLDIDFDMAEESSEDAEAPAVTSSFEAAELQVNLEADEDHKGHQDFNPEMEQEFSLDGFDFDAALASAQPDNLEFADELPDSESQDTLLDISEIQEELPEETAVIQDTSSPRKPGMATSQIQNHDLFEEEQLSEEELARRARERDQIRQALQEIRMKEGSYEDDENLLSRVSFSITRPFTTVFARFLALFRRKK